MPTFPHNFETYTHQNFHTHTVQYDQIQPSPVDQPIQTNLAPYIFSLVPNQQLSTIIKLINTHNVLNNNIRLYRRVLPLSHPIVKNHINLETLPKLLNSFDYSLIFPHNPQDLCYNEKFHEVESAEDHNSNSINKRSRSFNYPKTISDDETKPKNTHVRRIDLNSKNDMNTDPATNSISSTQRTIAPESLVQLQQTQQPHQTYNPSIINISSHLNSIINGAQYSCVIIMNQAALNTLPNAFLLDYLNTTPYPLFIHSISRFTLDELTESMFTEVDKTVWTMVAPFKPIPTIKPTAIGIILHQMVLNVLSHMPYDITNGTCAQSAIVFDTTRAEKQIVEGLKKSVSYAKEKNQYRSDRDRNDKNQNIVFFSNDKVKHQNDIISAFDQYVLPYYSPNNVHTTYTISPIKSIENTTPITMLQYFLNTLSNHIIAFSADTDPQILQRQDNEEDHVASQIIATHGSQYTSETTFPLSQYHHTIQTIHAQYKNDKIHDEVLPTLTLTKIHQLMEDLSDVIYDQHQLQNNTDITKYDNKIMTSNKPDPSRYLLTIPITLSHNLLQTIDQVSIVQYHLLLPSYHLHRNQPIEVHNKGTNESNSNLSLDELKKLYDSQYYLCNGLDLFISHELCSMCAMAAVHSRFANVFFLAPTSHGSLGSSYCLQHLPGINHRYNVFYVKLESKEAILQNGNKFKEI